MRDRPSIADTHQLDPAARRILERVEVDGIELVRFVYADHGGVIRGKATGRRRLAERFATGIGHCERLPASLGEALDALEADELLMEALGPLRRDAYLAVKRSEVADFAGQDAAYETFHHLRVF